MSCLFLNFGFEFTDLALYTDKTVSFCETIEHDIKGLAIFEDIGQQFEMRKALIMSLFYHEEFKKVQNIAISASQLSDEFNQQHPQGLNQKISLDLAKQWNLEAYTLGVPKSFKTEDLSYSHNSSLTYQINILWALENKLLKKHQNFRLAYLGEEQFFCRYENSKLDACISEDQGTKGVFSPGYVPYFKKNSNFYPFKMLEINSRQNIFKHLDQEPLDVEAQKFIKGLASALEALKFSNNGQESEIIIAGRFAACRNLRIYLEEILRQKIFYYQDNIWLNFMQEAWQLGYKEPLKIS